MAVEQVSTSSALELAGLVNSTPILLYAKYISLLVMGDTVLGVDRRAVRFGVLYVLARKHPPRQSSRQPGPQCSAYSSKEDSSPGADRE